MLNSVKKHYASPKGQLTINPITQKYDLYGMHKDQAKQSRAKHFANERERKDLEESTIKVGSLRARARKFKKKKPSGHHPNPSKNSKHNKIYTIYSTDKQGQLLF